MELTQDHRAQTKPLFSQPFVLAMGPQRAGTSWLDRYLREHKEVCLPSDVKEIFFFDRHFERGSDFYKSHFQPEGHHKFLMEISTTSFDHHEAPQRVFETFGADIKLLCPLRHPIVRSYSLYLHYLRYGIVQGTLEDACKQNPQIISSSRYVEHLKAWYEYYNMDQIHIVFQEELEENMEAYIKRICKILDLPYSPPSDEAATRYNVTTYSKSGTLANLAQHGADFLRSQRLYFVINLAKSIGLKRIIFGKERPDAKDSTVPAEDKAWLEERLGDQVSQLEELIGPIPYWEGV